MSNNKKNNVGTIDALWRFPVKSMAGQSIREAEITSSGVFGDRAYALIDTLTGKVVSAKSAKLFPTLLQCQAEFIEEPKLGHPIPAVKISLPNGIFVGSDARDVDQVLSNYFQRAVHLASVAPDDFTIDQYHPDIEGADPGGNRDAVVDQKLGSALFAALGAPSPVLPGSFMDVFPMSVMTTSLLEKFNELAPLSRFEARRFRMNVIVKTSEPGFVENAWLTHDLILGSIVKLNVALLDPRCVMTTLGQQDLPQDIDILRTLVRHNRIELTGLGKFPCAGVYAVVTSPGRVRVGDVVSIQA